MHDSPSPSPDDSPPATPSFSPARPARPASSAPSGLTLVLPSLKSLKAKKSKQNSRLNSPSVRDAKTPRPTKLKPLKEVLTKLIAQIKKKDDYAFFLTPVDPAQVPGYADVVKHPMDLGTMATKVARGRYRSLEDFASDFRLVTTNAKTFNPPGTIYHAEAERLETWGLDHIARAATTVIQYETDWNIEIEADDDAPPLNIDDDDDPAVGASQVGTPMDVDDAPTQGRSPSVVSQAQQAGPSRRPRGPYKKSAGAGTGAPAGISETIDADGRMPGSKDGLGAFPPGSDWARTMLALKLKGKRYKTKKERMRVEREGPPMRADGSLDYTEVEDPFSILSFFVPDPPARPHLTPLYPYTAPPSNPSYPQPSSQTPDASRAPSQLPQPPVPAPFPLPVTLADPIARPAPRLATASTARGPRPRHWTVLRSAARSKLRDADDDVTPIVPLQEAARPAHAADFGSFAVLAGALAEQMRRRGVVPTAGGEEAAAFEAIRESVEAEGAVKGGGGGGAEEAAEESYWTKARASDAEAYIRELVYGGVDGFAYVRSLAEFVAPPPTEDGAASTTQDARWRSGAGLGMPLAEWVVQHVVDPLTDGCHTLLRETARHLAAPPPPLPTSPLLSASNPVADAAPDSDSDLVAPAGPTPAQQIALSLYMHPAAARALAALRQIRAHKIDMSALIYAPEELFVSEKEWAGRAYKEARAGGADVAQNGDANGVKDGEGDGDVKMEADGAAPAGGYTQFELEGADVLNHVLTYTARVIAALDQRVREGGAGDVKTEPDTGELKSEDTHGVNGVARAEDAVMRDLRLNLLALAKRAPLDTITRLPKDLVPAHIRHYVPTLES